MTAGNPCTIYKALIYLIYKFVCDINRNSHIYGIPANEIQLPQDQY
jgi:hypothetical protein